jgi:hypothetical protein
LENGSFGLSYCSNIINFIKKLLSAEYSVMLIQRPSLISWLKNKKHMGVMQDNAVAHLIMDELIEAFEKQVISEEYSLCTWFKSL